MMTTLMLSQGVPMLVSGDEVRRTQRGNNNAYCQDNDTSWFDWRAVEKNADMFRFTQGLIAFRRSQPTVRRGTFLTGLPVAGRTVPDVSWYAPDGTPLNWGQGELAMMVYISAPAPIDDPDNAGRDILMLFNSTGEQREFSIPNLGQNLTWGLFVDTAADSPADIFPSLNGPKPADHGAVTLISHALKVFVSEASNR